MAFTLRPATVDDADFLFRLRTDPDVVAASNTSGAADLAQHVQWLVSTTSPLSDRLLDVVLNEAGTPIGHVRLDVRDFGRYAEVSIALIREARGQGLGTGILQEVARRAKHVHRLAWLEAVIKEDNAASRRVFTKAGFTIEGINDGLVYMSRYLAQ